MDENNAVNPEEQKPEGEATQAMPEATPAEAAPAEGGEQPAA